MAGVRLRATPTDQNRLPEQSARRFRFLLFLLAFAEWVSTAVLRVTADRRSYCAGAPALTARVQLVQLHLLRLPLGTSKRMRETRILKDLRPPSPSPLRLLALRAVVLSFGEGHCDRHPVVAQVRPEASLSATSGTPNATHVAFAQHGDC